MSEFLIDLAGLIKWILCGFVCLFLSNIHSLIKQKYSHKILSEITLIFRLNNPTNSVAEMYPESITFVCLTSHLSLVSVASVWVDVGRFYSTSTELNQTPAS